MEQQDAKNLITLEKFLDSLQDIISGFKSYVDQTNKRIDYLDKTIGDLAKRINENTSITREIKKDSSNKLENLAHNLSTQNGDWADLIGQLTKEIKTLQNEIQQLKGKPSAKAKKETKTKKEPSTKKTNKK